MLPGGSLTLLKRLCHTSPGGAEVVAVLNPVVRDWLWRFTLIPPVIAGVLAWGLWSEGDRRAAIVCAVVGLAWTALTVLVVARLMRDEPEPPIDPPPY